MPSRARIGERAHCASHHALLRPGRLVHERGRLVGAAARGQKLGGKLGEHTRAQEDDHSRATFRHGAHALARGHGGTSGKPRDHDRLADSRQRVFLAKRRRGTAKARHAGHHLVVHAARVECVHLLLDGAVQARVARVQAHHFLAPRIRRAHHVEHFLQGHVRAVVDDAGFLALSEQLGVHKASRPNDHVGRAQKARPAQRDKVGGARACANDMNHPSLPLPVFSSQPFTPPFAQRAKHGVCGGNRRKYAGRRRNAARPGFDTFTSAHYHSKSFGNEHMTIG